MTRTDADALAARQNANAPAGVSYAVTETVPATGETSPFYVKRVLARGAAEPAPAPRAGEQLTLA